MAFADLAGNMWDTEAVRVRAMVAARGNTITQLDPAERAKWVEATKPVYTAWIAQAKSKGLDGPALIESARALIAKYDKA
jgi:hypothetical protein